jgi:hypothetical protein
MSDRRRHACGYQLACTGASLFDDNEIGAPKNLHASDNGRFSLSASLRPAQKLLR